MLANLAAALFTHKSIKTTETKAKRLRPVAERLVTFAKKGDLHNRRRALAIIGDKSVIHELFTEIAPLVADREGGYTRITKLGFRKGDNASMVQIELVLEPVNAKPKAAASKTGTAKDAVKAAPVKAAAAESDVDTEDEVTPESDEDAVEETNEAVIAAKTVAAEAADDEAVEASAGDDPDGDLEK